MLCLDSHVSIQLRDFNQIYKAVDEVYHSYAKSHGLSDASFLVLYALAERGRPYPQRELCEDWFCSPQTVNSAVKSLEKQGLIELAFMPGSRKNKEIRFTPAGYELAKAVIEPFAEAEQNSFFRLDEHEREAMLSTIKKYIVLFKEEIRQGFHLEHFSEQ